MMKRLVKALLVAVAIVGVALSPLAPASASGSKTGLGTASVQLATPVSCTFPVSVPVAYTWNGFAGSNDTAAVWIGDSLYGAVTSQFQVTKVRGSGGTVTHTFGGLVPGVAYQGWGELFDGKGNAILGSLVMSSFVTC